jgi:predicted nucleic acid-binding OB-fold protein
LSLEILSLRIVIRLRGIGEKLVLSLTEARKAELFFESLAKGFKQTNKKNIEFMLNVLIINDIKLLQAGKKYSNIS